MNKCGSFLGLSLGNLVRLTIIVLILFMFLSVASKLYYVFYGHKEETALEGFNALADTIELMASRNTSSFEYSKKLISITGDFRIIGYSSGYASTPNECQGKACICLFKPEISCNQNSPVSGSEPIACRSFSKPDVIGLYSMLDRDPSQNNSPSLTPYYPESAQAKYSFLSMQICTKERKDVQISTIYIEKFIPDNVPMTQFFIIPISPFFKDIDADMRINLLSKCPPDSSTECVSKLRNSKANDGFCMFENDKCIFMNIPECEMNQRTSTVCSCGSLIIKTSAYCVLNKVTNLKEIAYANCFNVKSCEDYCEMFEPFDECNDIHGLEQKNCALNPCNIQHGCKPTNQIVPFGKENTMTKIRCLP